MTRNWRRIYLRSSRFDEEIGPSNGNARERERERGLKREGRE